MSDRWPISPSAVALDLLDDDERRLADTLLAEDPEFAAAVERQQGLGTLLAELPAPIRRPEPAPPLAAATQAAPRRRRFPGLRLTLPALAAVAAAAVLAVVITGSGEDGPSPSPEPVRAAVTLKPIGQVTGTATITIEGDRAELVGSGLPPSRAGEHYEAWLARDNGEMTAMGGFRVGQDGSVEAGMPFHEDLAQYTYVDVSIEPDGGPPKHSGTSVLRARL